MTKGPRKIFSGFELPPVPAEIPASRQELEEIRTHLRALRRRREGLAAIASIQTEASAKARGQLPEVDAEIAELEMVVEARSVAHVELVDAYERQAHKALAGELERYEQAVVAAMENLMAVVGEGAQLRQETSAIGFRLPARALEAAPHLRRLIEAPARLVGSWR